MKKDGVIYRVFDIVAQVYKRLSLLIDNIK